MRAGDRRGQEIEIVEAGQEGEAVIHIEQSHRNLILAVEDLGDGRCTETDELIGYPLVIVVEVLEDGLDDEVGRFSRVEVLLAVASLLEVDILGEEMGRGLVLLAGEISR